MYQKWVLVVSSFFLRGLSDNDFSRKTSFRDLYLPLTIAAGIMIVEPPGDDLDPPLIIVPRRSLKIT